MLIVKQCFTCPPCRPVPSGCMLLRSCLPPLRAGVGGSLWRSTTSSMVPRACPPAACLATSPWCLGAKGKTRKMIKDKAARKDPELRLAAMNKAKAKSSSFSKYERGI